jgi:hypothetical protein
MSEMSKDQETSGEQGNVGRRRLVRGVVAFAPLVLTLRSGGLAAASAGAAVIAYGTVDDKGKITVKSNPGGRSVQQGDRCVTGAVATSKDYRVSGGQADALGITTTGNSGHFACGSFKVQQTNGTVQVAILSSASVTSL